MRKHHLCGYLNYGAVFSFTKPWATESEPGRVCSTQMLSTGKTRATESKGALLEPSSMPSGDEEHPWAQCPWWVLLKLKLMVTNSRLGNSTCIKGKSTF